jgi:tetratricopeptide (TPR) repeat protein
MQRRLGAGLGAWVLLALLCVLPAASPLAQSEAPGEGSSPEEQSYLLWQEGYFYHLVGAYERAIERFSESIEVMPTAEAYTYRGWSLSKLERFEEAIRDCKAAIRVDPDYGNPYNDIGAYLIHLGRLEEAIPWLKKATRAKRYCCFQFAHFNLGRVLLMQGRIREAKRAFEALELIRQQGLKST